MNKTWDILVTFEVSFFATAFGNTLPEYTAARFAPAFRGESKWAYETLR